MRCDTETILERAVRIWEASDFAYLDPVLSDQQPEAFELGYRIATDYATEFRDELISLLDSSNANVVAHSLDIIGRSGIVTHDAIPTQLMTDSRAVTIPGCIFREHSIGELAGLCAANLKSLAGDPDRR
ncbi:hypothetical protein [Stieleria neptunia]|uniref:hypothetical protein n=1 Tax=Stieleria neptunia TaxID=2527979 RepID=UPI0011A6DF96|nr:hypothetical protein [Stieleria neptunia]